ncbi:hypothetical protein PENSTE_c005G08532 [Penicillium steckii]|uniref:Uncharacterized protein n=1 Tax=Penicillium steckii TaxID=303698 RepID=A0A1V6TKI1_9EURO|nr:hypothetical protein PENSTE_c005G08532 [Penicillium steckii]
MSSDLRGTKRPAENEEDEGSRKHGKRLTTKEEVSLFDLCNRHADTFGKRSDICNWWKTIATEFTLLHGRPYSWHSVRRKVEAVTKQRIKFLDEQRQRQRDFSGSNTLEDVMNPQWCAVLDTWIPNWQRWEESEARRIAKRDEMIMRRRSNKPSDQNQWKSPDGQAIGMEMGRAVSPPTSPGTIDVGASHSFQDEASHVPGDVYRISSSTSTPAPPNIAPPAFETPSAPATNVVRLPPGFENMFSNPIPISHVSASPTPVAPSTVLPDPSNNTRMFGAVLETLGKLNKHLDAASANGNPDARSSPVISALVQAASESSSQVASHQDAQREIQQYSGIYDVNRIKDELRQELKAELRHEIRRDCAALEEKIDSVQRTQEMILEMLRQEPA